MKAPSNSLYLSAVSLALLWTVPFAKAEETEAKSSNIHLMFEFIEVSLADFSDWLTDHRLNSDATELRSTVQKWSKEDKALVFETVVIQARSGQRAKAESIAEVIYPTEYDPSEIPNKLSNIHNLVESPTTALSSTAYETRNVGVTVEVDPVVNSGGKTISLNMAPEIVRRLENLTWPNDGVDPKFQAEMPQFYTAKITTQVEAKAGVPTLVGTIRLPEPVKQQRDNPVVLVFARADLD